MCCASTNYPGDLFPMSTIQSLTQNSSIQSEKGPFKVIFNLVQTLTQAQKKADRANVVALPVAGMVNSVAGEGEDNILSTKYQNWDEHLSAHAPMQIM